MNEASWRALGVPVGLAFFVRAAATETGTATVTAAYPGPGGAVQSQVDPAAWEALLRDNPALRDLEPDVEAWLVDRRQAPPASWRLSIDHCYRLTGLVRSHWRGISGGDEVLEEVRRFFGSLPGAAA